MFKKILIANRGEIACRVITTCRRLGIKTVAVYSAADRTARHVRLADEAVHIGGAAPADSYLRGAAIIAAAKNTGAEAVHPGFGFLSENSAFARQCSEAGLIFIGPSAESMDAMASKSAAKTLLEKAGVPVTPGYHGAEQSLKKLESEAARIGYPLMIKATAGGGGKGMRVVHDAGDFKAALESAQREAKSAFGDDRVLLEKFINGPRHIEFQVFGDNHGNVLHLFERECSIQRRYQKIIEETPSPFLDDDMRARMGEAAVAAARAVQYVNAGTVEFIVGADRSFYFMEMNTRLQVEHPITELTTGLDLVEWQLRVAAGEALPLQQQDITRHGHAIEVRLYAENPRQDFLPSVGTLTAFVTPAESANFRLDSGVESGDAITIHYDPMIAKLVVWDHARATAISRLRDTLNHTAVFGLTTNLPLLRRIATDTAFAGGEIDTRYIDAHLASLNEEPPPPAHVLDAAALDILLDDADAPDPWDRLDGFQANAQGGRRVVLRDAAGNQTSRHVRFCNPHWVLTDDGGTRAARATLTGAATLMLNSEDENRRYSVLRLDERIQIVWQDTAWELDRVYPFAADQHSGADDAHPGSPMPGRIVAIHVKAGDTVQAGDPLLVLEGMKMEYTVKARISGIVEQLLYNVSDLVEAEVPLVDIQPVEGD